MKRITRVTHAGVPLRVWLDQFGSWTRDKSLAFVFDDDEAARRLKRLPHAETEDVPNPEESNDEHRASTDP